MRFDQRQRRANDRRLLVALAWRYGFGPRRIASAMGLSERQVERIVEAIKQDLANAGIEEVARMPAKA